MPGVLERRGEDVDLRWWQGWRCLGERERRRRGLGVEDGYGRRGEREGEVDMGRRWRARWRPGEREWWWRGLGVVWFGLGQGLCRTPWPMVSTRLCADTTGLGESRLSGPKACRTVDRPRTPRWHTREGDAAVPVCVARAGQEGGACMLVALAGHDGSHGCAAPGPARWRRCRSSVSGFPRCGLVRPCRRL